MTSKQLCCIAKFIDCANSNWPTQQFYYRVDFDPVEPGIYIESSSSDVLSLVKGIESAFCGFVVRTSAPQSELHSFSFYIV